MITSTPIDIFIYIITIIQSVFYIVIGLLLVKKYTQYKHLSLLYWGISFILVNSPWIAYIVNYTFYLFTENQLTLQMFYFIGYMTIIPSAGAWVMAIFNSIHKKYLKFITPITLIVVILYLVLFMTFLVLRMDLIGDVVGFWKIKYGMFLQLFMTSALLIYALTNILYALNARKTKDRELRFKAIGFFLMTIFFSSGALIEIIPFIDVTLASVSRTLLALSAFSIYVSAVWPKWVQKLVLKEKFNENK